MTRILLLALSIVSFSFASSSMEEMRAARLRKPISKDNVAAKDRSQLRAAPTGPVRNIAEFEPHEGCIISYSGQFGISMDVIKEVSEVTKVYCLTSSSNQNTVISSFSSASITNYEIVIHNSDAYWTRDCAPWWIFDGNDEACIIDFNYNRNRPNDNQIPAKMSSELGVSYYDMEIDDCGGNYMCDGLGLAAATELVEEENPYDDVAQIKKTFLGIDNFITMPDPLSSYIDHIDCWAKFLAPDKIMIIEVPANNVNYNKLEAQAQKFANTTSSYGTKFKVYRVYASQGEPYTNCLIINNKVLVPTKGTSNDANALQAYRDAMPGYDVIGLSDNGYPSWKDTDALHCRTKGIPDRGMLYIEHIPLYDTVFIDNSSESVEVASKILAHSGESLKSDSLLVCYKFSYDSYYKTVTLSDFGSDLFKGNIPLPTASSSVEYYITASDNSGRRETHPYMGNEDPHTFFIDMGNVPVTEVLSKQSKLNVNALQAKRSVLVQFEMPGNVSNGFISLYNSKGVKIDSKANLSGNGRLNLGKQLSKGVYFIRVNAGSMSQTKSLMIN